MRVLYFHQHFTTPSGAGGTRSFELARRLVERGHAVTMVCGSAAGADTGLRGSFVSGQREGMVDGIHVIELDLPYANRDDLRKRTLTFLRFVLATARLAVAARRRYDLVFATSTPLTAGIPGILARHLAGVPFVFEVRDLWPELPRAMGVVTNPLALGCMSALEWLCYRSATACVGLSPGIVNGIKSRGVPEERVCMIPNACDLELFSPDGDRRRPTGAHESDLVAVFAGAHGQANGLHALLDAAAELRRRGRDDIKLVLIGDGKAKPSLQAKADEESLGNVIFMPPVPKTLLPAYLRGADIGLMVLANVPAFYYGTSPNKFFDYIASGLPVLNNYPGWLAEMISLNHCGMAVRPDDPDAFADALVHMADHRRELHQMAVNARALAEREFSRRTLADRFVDWLERAAALGGHRASRVHA